MDIDALVHELQRLHLADDEVLIVRPKYGLDRNGLAILHRNLSKVADALGWGDNRIVVLDRDVDLTVVKADQLELA